MCDNQPFTEIDKRKTEYIVHRRSNISWQQEISWLTALELFHGDITDHSVCIQGHGAAIQAGT